MKKRMTAFGLALVSLAAGFALASSGSPSISADEALQRLMDGNKRYIENKLTNGSRSDAASRKALANSQKPYAIIQAVAPSVKIAAKDCEVCKGAANCSGNKPGEYMECVVDANAKHVAGNLTRQSRILKHLVEEKKIRIVAARYDLDEGLVTLLK